MSGLLACVLPALSDLGLLPLHAQLLLRPLATAAAACQPGTEFQVGGFGFLLQLLIIISITACGTLRGPLHEVDRILLMVLCFTRRGAGRRV